MAELPLYNATLASESDGIFAVSLVADPAVMTDFIRFGKQEKPERKAMKYDFSVSDGLEHCITGVLLKANVPVYRISPDMGEYLLNFTPEVIKKMAENMTQRGGFATNDIEHDENYFWDKLRLRELYIKDSTKGISPVNFEDVPDGSLFATYKVQDVDLWEKIEKEEVKGFSIEAWITPVKAETEDEELLSIIRKIEQRIANRR